MIHGNMHVWKSNNQVMLSNEQTKTLKSFKTYDDCINYLYVNGHKDAARQLNKEKQND